MSDRASAVLPRACSGDRYWAVPSTAAVCVMVVESPSARAMPKSMTFTAPVFVSMMFAGLTSRWMMPCRCEKSSAPHTSARIDDARRGSSGPSRRTMSRSVSPCTSSITMNGTVPIGPSVSPVSYTATMEEWFSSAAFFASRRKRSRKFSSRARSARIIFTATSRPSSVSDASYTSDMPPTPMIPPSR